MTAKRGLILAAGRGIRMGGATEEKPKGLVELAGRSLIAWQKASLRAAGIEEVAAVGGYRAKMLESLLPVPFVNDRWVDTNMVASLLCARKWLEKGPCVVLYSDIVFHPDWVKKLLAAEGDIVITADREWRALWESRFEDPLSDAETFRMAPEGTLVEIGAKADSIDQIEGQYMGLMRFASPAIAKIDAVLGTLSPQDRLRLDMTGLLSTLIGRGVPVQVVMGDGRWAEVDTPADLDLCQSRIATDRPWSHDWRWQGE